MSLHDLDKQNHDRANPKLNADDNVISRMAHETNSTTYRNAGSGVNQGLVFQQGVIQSYDAHNLKNVFFGYDPSLNATRPVLRVAKDGYDATTATDDQLIFNSEQDMFKIVTSSTATVTVPNPMVASTTYTTTVAHGLSSTPAFLAFVTTPANLNSILSGQGNQIIQTPYSIPVSVGTVDRPIVAQVHSSGTNIYFDVINYQSVDINNVNGDWVFRYYVLQETAT